MLNLATSLLLFGTIGFDATSTSGYQSAAASYSGTHTCAGSNRNLTVFVHIFGGGDPMVTALTYGGVAMTRVRDAESASGTYHVEVWNMAAPASGSNTLAVTLSASVDFVVNAISLTGVDQDTPTHASSAGAGVNGAAAADAIAPAITLNVDGSWLLAGVTTDDAAITASQTSRQNVSGASGSAGLSSYGPGSSGVPISLSWTAVGANNTWIIAQIAIDAVTATETPAPWINVIDTKSANARLNAISTNKRLAL